MNLAAKLAEEPNLGPYVSSLRATTDADPKLDELAGRLDLLLETTERHTRGFEIRHVNVGPDTMVAGPTTTKNPSARLRISFA